MGAESVDGLDERMIKEFGRHFISLTCDHHDPKKPGSLDRFVTSGFLMSIKDVWFMATAGHVIDAIITRMEQEPQRSYHFGLIDNFGADAKHEEIIPFDFKGALKWQTDLESTGADFGLILISPYYRRLMEANKPVPITEAQWRYTRDEPFEFHVIMGIPNETVTRTHVDFKQYTMAMIPVTEITELPPTIPRRPYPTFYATLGPTTGIKSIEGMSGCPIFGFAKDTGGLWRYWIVAVQSSWYYDRMPRIIAASLFRDLALEAEAYFEAEMEDEDIR
jgi:hypothetical protein